MGLFMFAPEIMRLFSCPRFAGAAFTLQLIAPVIFLVGLGHLFGMQLLIPGGFEKQYLFATLLGMGISLLLNLLLIKTFQDKGAAVTLVITEGVVSFMAYFFVIRKMNLRMHWPLAVKAFVASLLFIPVALLLRSTTVPLTFGLFIAVLVSAALYFIVQIFLFKETLLRSMLSLVLKSLLNDVSPAGGRVREPVGGKRVEFSPLGHLPHCRPEEMKEVEFFLSGGVEF